MKLRIDRPEYGGGFLGRDDSGAEHAVRFVLPHELVEVSAPGDKGALKILEGSADRVAPRCRHFGVCGGCDYQHASYRAQSRIKQDILLVTLHEGGLQDPPAIAVHSGEPWEYRNRVRLRVEAVDGAFRMGYNRRGGREFLPIVECPISSPLVMRAAEVLLKASRPWLASIAEVEFFASNDGKALQMTVLTRDRRVEGFGEFCAALAGGLPELKGAGVLAASAGYGAKERVTWGAGGIVQEVRGVAYWVSRGGFFQVNRFLIGQMVDLVTAGRTGGLAWDLYAGVGLFSRVLLEGFDAVVAVEAGEPAAADLARIKPKTGDFRAVAASAETFLQGAAVQRERPDLIVMDPPRAGVGAEVCRLLGRIGAAEMVYVSCDPVTLARDLRMLVDSGYRAREVHLIDMFPQTFHLESVVFLTKTLVS